MANVQGTQVRAALKKSAVWDTAVTVGVGDGLYVTSPLDNVPERDLVMDEAVGIAVTQKINYGNRQPIAADVVADLHYEGFDLTQALVMGTVTSVSQTSSGSSAFDWQYDLNDTVNGLMGTYVTERGTQIFEYPSIKVTGVEFAGEAGAVVTIAIKNLRNKLLLPSMAGIVNTTGSFASVTYPDVLNRVMFNQSTFRINRDSAGALGSGDVINPSGFTLTLQRALEGDFVSDGSDYITEPEVTGLIEVKLTLEFPQYDAADSYEKDFLESSNVVKFDYKADVEFIGAIIDGAETFKIKFEFPSLHLDVPQSGAEGPGKITRSLTFTGFIAQTAPTGMSGLTQPIRMSGVNTVATSPLA